MIESKNRPTHHDGVKKLSIGQQKAIENTHGNVWTFQHKLSQHPEDRYTNPNSKI